MNEVWNARFAEDGYAYGTEVNAFLASRKQYLHAGMQVLAVADGEGRNGVWLAQRGMDVLSVDASEVGLAKAQQLAKDRGVTLHTELADLTVWAWPQGRFDALVAVYIHFMPAQRVRMHHAMLAALKSGGILILEAFTPKQLAYSSGGPAVSEMLYTADMLRADFAEGEILFLEERVTRLEEGRYHRGEASVVSMVLRRPVIDRNGLTGSPIRP